MYCILFLHQTTTHRKRELHFRGCIASSFYIKPQPLDRYFEYVQGCIASSFYIKPQLIIRNAFCGRKLYCILFLHQTTTSRCASGGPRTLYCILFLHQTTTGNAWVYGNAQLYCILFLHQTTTVSHVMAGGDGCIASSFYIKPQLNFIKMELNHVVLHPLSTSNHNQIGALLEMRDVVLHPLSTSNHNRMRFELEKTWVVLHPLSTSNHNDR